MAFRFCILVSVILYKGTGSQERIYALPETIFEATFTSQANGDNVTTSPSTTLTSIGKQNNNVDEENSTEHYASSATDMQTFLERSNTNETWIALVVEETSEAFPGSTSSPELGTSTWRSSESDVTHLREEPGDNSDYSAKVNEPTNTRQLDNESASTEGTVRLSQDVTNVTVSSEEWISTYSSRESRGYGSNSSSGVQGDILILLRSNCSIVNSENTPLTDVFVEVGCTIYLRINISLEDGTRDKLLRNLEKLTIRTSDFQIVKAQDQAEDATQANHQKHHNHFLEPETFAYLAVAFCFGFLLILAVIVFGYRCFKKQRPSTDVSPFDVKLSSYTLTKIPRASLTSVDCSPASDSLDGKTEPHSVQSRNCGSCESGLDIIPCDSFSSNREMKTFGVPRSTVSRNADSPSDTYPQHSAIAYENHTFQRYF